MAVTTVVKFLVFFNDRVIIV